jgi:hypothetical protein
MHKGKSLEEVIEIVEDYRSSKLTKLEYCNEKGINYYCFDWYIRRIRESKEKRVIKEVKKGFVHLEVEEDFSSNSSIILKYKDLSIELKENFNPDDFKKIIKLIGFSSNV